MTDKKTIEDALAEMEANIAKTAESQAKQLPELEAEIAKQNAFSLRMAALSQSQRRQVLDAAGMRHISAAPPPITPLNASGHSHPSKRQLQAPIDWRYWRHMPEVKQWEACALSLNIEPSSMKHSNHAWMSGPGSAPIFTSASFPSDAVKTEFDKRLRLLGASLFKSGFFTTANKLVVGGRHLATINLEQFARWGLHVEFEMPPELVGITVNKPIAAPEQKTVAPTPVVTENASEGLEPAEKMKRQTWKDVSFPYVVKIYKSGQYATAKAFYKTLESKAGTDDSPFDKGTGQNAGNLYVREIGKGLALKTIENAWAAIRASK